MREPEVALAFTADVWVEELHRHLTDHGGARVRTLLVEPEGALDEAYDVLVAGHRWPALTRALVADVRAHDRAVVGVHDREEPASREHLIGLGVDVLIESDAAPDAFVRAIVSVAGRREDRAPAHPLIAPTRAGRLVSVGGPPGVGRTEVAIELALALGRRAGVALVDADDIAPAVAARLHLPIEPNLRAAVDAVEHGRGELDACVVGEPTSGLRVVTGLPSASGWAQVRPGEIVRVIDRLAENTDFVVVDGAGSLEDVSAGGARGRFATARAIVAEADIVLAVCEPSPHGVARFLGWAVEAHALASHGSSVVVVNRAPTARFRRGEVYEELARSLPLSDIVFVPADRRVGDAAWNGAAVVRGPFTRAMDEVARHVLARSRRPRQVADVRAAS